MLGIKHLAIRALEYLNTEHIILFLFFIHPAHSSWLESVINLNFISSVSECLTFSSYERKTKSLFVDTHLDRLSFFQIFQKSGT